MSKAKKRQKTNQDWTPALKAKAVKYALKNYHLPMVDRAKHIGCSSQSLSVWIDAYRGDVPAAKTLPMKSDTSGTRRKSTKALVAAGYQCPHCGESVEVPS